MSRPSPALPVTRAAAARLDPEQADTAAHVLVCSGCGTSYPDDGLLLRCPQPHPPAFLQTRYDVALAAAGRPAGLARFARWLPGRRPIQAGAGQSVVYRSSALAARLDLPELWIAFNGYWPERSAQLITCSFKELEAYTALARLPLRCPPVVVASIGNTAAAFAAAFGAAGRPCLLLVPESGAHRLTLPTATPESVRLVVLADAGYQDVMELADQACAATGAQSAGGAWNVARRDGLGTVMLAAAEELGGLPDYYVQAIGSGVGAIAAWEAARRIDPGTLPRMLLCQNAENAPVAALHGSQRPACEQVRPFADELLNPHPPYSVVGGLRDVLDGTGGRVLVADSAAARAAQALFAETEGIDIEPAPALAVACLADAVASGRIERNSRILLNITGGGRDRLAADRPPVPITVTRRIRADEPTGTRLEQVVRVLDGLAAG
jgi:cysteate synthase